MSEWPDETMLFRVEKDQTNVGRVLREVYRALEEKGYDPVNQIVGYLISGDPTYITSHRNARGLMRSVERDEVIEELVRLYLKTLTSPNP
ncbi:MAG: IreB family regulatory phosphoprotein [Firmicutes bacterium]|nr:IreB family regulatory phosphoprotein [Bacillota bacterium]